MSECPSRPRLEQFPYPETRDHDHPIQVSRDTSRSGHANLDKERRFSGRRRTLYVGFTRLISKKSSES